MKPSERIDKIHTELLSRYSVRPDDTDWVYEKFKAISTFLDEQAESQEPKALEERKCHCQFSPCVCSCGECGPAKPQEELNVMPKDKPCKHESGTDGCCRLCGGEPQEEPCKECHAFLGHARRCSMRRDDPKDYGFRDHRHCPEKDSPCGMKGKHPCCLCGTEPQEEPKDGGFGIDEAVEDLSGLYPVRPEETEPKEAAERDMDLDRCKNKECIGYKNGYADGAMIEKEQNALKNSSAIILPRPKGKSIDRTFHEFQLFWEGRHADYVDDDKFLNEWNQFIKSQE